MMCGVRDDSLRRLLPRLTCCPQCCPSATLLQALLLVILTAPPIFGSVQVPQVPYLVHNLGTTAALHLGPPFCKPPTTISSVTTEPTAACERLENSVVVVVASVFAELSLAFFAHSLLSPIILRLLLHCTSAPPPPSRIQCCMLAHDIRKPYKRHSSPEDQYLDTKQTLFLDETPSRSFRHDGEPGTTDFCAVSSRARHFPPQPTDHVLLRFQPFST